MIWFWYHLSMLSIESSRILWLRSPTARVTAKSLDCAKMS